MRIIAVRTLRQFWRKHPDAEQWLKAWYADVKKAHWEKPTDIIAAYATASTLSGDRAVFNIRGNKYRMVVAIHYRSSIVYIRFIGTHQEYDQIDAETI